MPTLMYTTPLGRSDKFLKLYELYRDIDFANKYMFHSKEKPKFLVDFEGPIDYSEIEKRYCALFLTERRDEFNKILEEVVSGIKPNIFCFL